MLNILVLDLQFDCTHVSIMYFLRLCSPCTGRGLDVKKACHCLSITLENTEFLSLSLSSPPFPPLPLSLSLSHTFSPFCLLLFIAKKLNGTESMRKQNRIFKKAVDYRLFCSTKLPPPQLHPPTNMNYQHNYIYCNFHCS